ncbi:MAG TPA: carboxypeptidase regulatory-like domain-containing protein [Chitinophaga sp.]|uniref:TonB-dependent receptor n=1 Tax=Chitinophaga sp. TaxID=1869181 RepID=UPI002C9A54E4|nr:carboxypeptidase regulatory-like domain-containing protein [Chitinophaga sp.]HVI46918.1 carboxypeptidase regulatory-like domain-containing protein [Chitinophaga sp.]
MHRKIYNYFLGMLCCILFIPFVLHAQETTADIAGIVNSSQGAIPGASIIAVHQPSGTKYVTVSRKDGRFNLPNLRIGGPYVLTISYIGFKDEKRENIFLTLGQEYKATISLETSTSSLNEVVVKTNSQSKIFNRAHTGSQEIITRAQMDRLPTISRSMADFTRLTPSANNLSFGGRSNQYNNITVDGANFNNSFGLQPTLGSQTNSQPISLDALEQIQVNISPYDVRQGGFSGAGINSVTKSGTNDFKGTIYTNIQTPGLQGLKVGTTTVTKPSFDYNLRGFTVGGPIIRNKLFFFVSGEQERISAPATSWIANTKPGGSVSGNTSQAVADTLDKLRKFLMDKYSYDPGDYQNYTYRTYSDKVTLKLDWNINNNNTFTLKYNYLKSYKDIPASNSGAPGSGRQPSLTGLPFSGSGYTINNNFNIFIAELNTRIGNHASNKLQIGYSALRDFRSSLSGGNFPLVDILNGQGQSYTAFGYEPFTYNNKLKTDVFQLSDIFNLYKGSHEITIGTQNYLKTFMNGFAPNYNGIYRYNTLTDFYASATTGALTTNRYALSYSTTKDGSFPYGKINMLELGVFIQDKWSINNYFTLTYGLRIDVPVIGSTFDKNDSLAALTFRDGIQVDVGHAPKTTPLFSPRVGFNWDVTHDNKTQIRGGVGLFAGPPPAVWLSNQASNNGVQFGSFVAQASNNSTIPYPFNPDPNAYRNTSGSLATAYNIAVTDKNFKYPQVLKASLAIDRQLPWGVIATLEANYSKDINAVYFQNINLPTSGFTLDSTPDNRTRYSSGQIYGPVAAPGKNTLSNPNISDAILMRNASKGYSYFITFQLQKNTPNLSLSAAYTYSKARTINDGGSIAQGNWRDRPVSGDPNAPVLGYANFYLPHRVIASASYRFNWARHFATSIGMVFEAAPNGVTSYTYNGDVNNDASNGNNDLIFIPANAKQINLVPVGYGDKNFDPNNPADKRSTQVTWNQLDNFIKQDDYLSRHRGEYAERNAVVLPFYKRVDLNITQDIFMFTGKNKVKHTLRLTFDIMNFGNFLNRKWGINKLSNIPSFLKYEGQVRDANGKPTAAPAYSFPYLDNANQIPLTNSWRENTNNLSNNFNNYISRWQGQIGIRYIFN